MVEKTRPFELECDASLYATGGVLCQQDSDSYSHLVVYISKSLTETEWNYDIYDRELLAIVRAFEEFHKYFYGAPYLIRILTDHQNLTYFRKPQRLNQWQSRWWRMLQQYWYTLQYKVGKDMGQSDGLSRQGTMAHAKLNNDNIILLDNWLWILPIHSSTEFVLKLVKGWKRRQIWQEVTIHSIETPMIEQ